MAANFEFPLRHLSLRVPWHDAGWSGLVCHAPHLNGSCTRLKRIADQKQDEAERSVAGSSLNVLPPDEWPSCVSERGAFMAPFEMEHSKSHALAPKNPEVFGHFLDTPQRYPAYSAGAIPYRWLMRESYEELGKELELDVDPAREPTLRYDSNWVNEGGNQAALLEGFAGHLRIKESLCLFYAKHVPFVEGAGRILVGVGRLLSLSPLTEYRQSPSGMRGMVWERPVQHSIRPNGKDGFLLPYDEVLTRAGEDPTLDASQYAAHAPSEHWDEFSYGSELVTHDGAISALLSIDAALERIESGLGIESGWKRQWVHDELVRLWNVRGPYPGLGAVLRAFGLSRGLFVAHALQQIAGENADPWPQVDAAFRDPGSVLPPELHRDVRELASTWIGLPERRKQVLRILSRFELSVRQAERLYDEDARRKRGWAASDSELIANPYRIYEVSRLDPEGVHLLTVDRGIYPDDAVRVKNPLPAPSQPDSAIDPRRVRAFAIAALESDAAQGHTLTFAGDLAQSIRTLAVKPECPVTTDSLTANAPNLEPEIASLETDDRPALQLSRYQAMGKLKDFLVE